MPRTRSGEPIRRSSLEKGSFERGWFAPVPIAQCRRLAVAAERYERDSREPGQRAGKIGTTGLELLGLFLRLQTSSPDGRLEPSYLWISRALRRSIDAVSRAITNLVEAGLLERARRVEWRGEDEEAPVWRQATNAYRIRLPDWFSKALPAVMRPVPPPPDFAMAHAAATAGNAAMARELGPRDYARHEVGEGGLADSLGRLGAAIAAAAKGATEGATRNTRDSVERRESPRRSSLEEDCGVALSGDNSGSWAAPAAPRGAAGARGARNVPD